MATVSFSSMGTLTTEAFTITINGTPSTATLYKAYLSDEQGIAISNYNVWSTAGQTSVNYTFTGLSAGTKYTYSVLAYPYGVLNALSNPSYPGGTLFPACTIASTPVDLYADAGETSMTLYANAADGVGIHWWYKKTSSSTWIDNGWTAPAGDPQTISGLSALTSYDFRVASVSGTYDNGSYVYSTYAYITKSTYNPLTQPPGIPQTPTIVSQGSNSVSLSWPAVGYATSYEVYVKVDTYYSLYKVLTVYTNSATVDNLMASTSYAFALRAVNSYGSSDMSNQTNSINMGGITRVPELRVVTTTSSSITLEWDHRIGVNYYRVFGKVQGTSQFTIQSAYVYAPNNTVTITGLTNNTFYELRLTVSDKISGQYFETIPANMIYITVQAKASAWVWSELELNAFNNKGPITTLTYQRWNAFVNAARDKLIANNLYDTPIGSGSGLPYTSTTTYGTVISDALLPTDGSNKTLLAAKFNNFRYCVGSMNSISPTIPIVASGDKIYGWYFISIATAINS